MAQHAPRGTESAQGIFSVSQQDETPLHLASNGGHANVCTLLLDRGASVEARNDNVTLATLRVKHSDACLHV